MSKFYTLLLTLTSFFALTAQDCDTIYSHDGTSEISGEGYDLSASFIDLDGSTYSFAAVTGSFHVFTDSISPTDSNNYFWATSWFAESDTASNLILIDKLLVPEGTTTVSWDHRHTDVNFRDGYTVLASSNNNGDVIVASFSDNADETADKNKEWESQSGDISSLAGDSVMLYFWHNALDMNTLNLDNILITNCASDDDTTVIDDTTIIDDTTSNSDTVIIVDTVTNTDTVYSVVGDTIYTTIYDTIIITETIEVPGDDITATIVIDIEGTCNDISTGITEGDFTANELTAYPNPVLDVLNIQINNTSSISGSFTLNIYAIDGSLVKTETISSTAAVDLSSLEAGFHVIEVIGANEVLAHQKFLKN